ncbi:MAG TPA: tRNA uridine-5-carboxymethylaminomethyl(34) synthesis GTPase MnmE [Cytophagaceae bacterium]|nr:tRNA uridine-5-carboxymethylaminomethyl(34) synthesis GTPase MnmE [Cytophagaceae bacterium]
MILDIHDTIVAPATAPGVGAIAVIRLSGKEAISICQKVFKGKDLTKQESHTIHFGTIVDQGAIVDEVLVSIFKAPKSFTKENIVEISCHGSNYIIGKIIRLLIASGARYAKPGEFTQRAFINGRFDLAQAEAVADLIASDSEASHRAAMNQMRGGISEEIKLLRDELIGFAALIELELDFSEEDLEFADRTRLRNLVVKIQHMLFELLNTFQLGNAIKTGVSTVIAGRPNAGKSTLLNALLNEERAIVSEIAGTTRDTIEEKLVIRGVEFRLIDTAGIREATDAIEAIGVEKTFEKIKHSALLVYMFDASTLSIEEARKDILELTQHGVPFVVVPNKMDLLPEGSYVNPLPMQLNNPVIGISAGKKEHIEELKNELYSIVVGGRSLADKAIVTNARHYEALSKSKEALEKVQEGLDAQISSDLLAEDIRQALYYLGTITGEIDVDKDILGTIFGKFCIGK